MHDLSPLSDPELIAEAEQIRDELEHVPQDSVSRADLGRLYDALAAEFDRRVSSATITR